MSADQPVDYLTLIGHVEKLGVPVFDFVNHLTKGEMIGSGAAMNVFKGCLTANGKDPVKVALKEPGKALTSRAHDRLIGSVLADVRQELRIMKHLEAHPYIVNLYGVAFQGLNPILIVELAIGKLPDHLYDCKEEGKRLDWSTKSRFCCEIADGLRALHLVDVVHGDIKGDNVLLFADSEH